VATRGRKGTSSELSQGKNRGLKRITRKETAKGEEGEGYFSHREQAINGDEGGRGPESECKGRLRGGRAQKGAVRTGD